MKKELREIKIKYIQECIKNFNETQISELFFRTAEIDNNLYQKTLTDYIPVPEKDLINPVSSITVYYGCNPVGEYKVAETSQTITASQDIND